MYVERVAEPILHLITNKFAHKTPLLTYNNNYHFQIVVDIAQDEYSGAVDGSNALVLPSAKRETRAKIKDRKVTRILSKRQRKKLEKIVDKKHKKENVNILFSSSKSHFLTYSHSLPALFPSGQLGHCPTTLRGPEEVPVHHWIADERS